MNLWNRTPPILTGNNLKHQDMELHENESFCIAKETVSIAYKKLIGWEKLIQLDFRQGTNIHNLQRIIEIKY